MKFDKPKQVNNTTLNQVQIDLKNNASSSISHQHISHSETKYEAVQYHSASSKAVPQITLQRITDNQIEQLSKKQQFLFENDINQKIQGIVHSSRADKNSQRVGLFQNQSHNMFKFQHQFSDQMNHESNFDSSEQLPQPRHGHHKTNNNNSSSQQQQHWYLKGSNHHQHHSHHLSLSETRSLKSFRSLHDQRLQRQLKRRNDKSNQGSSGPTAASGGGNNVVGEGGSQQRQLSNVREMFNSKEEVKLFEQKFKGSLEKLDEFEKEWQDFKVTHISVTASANSISYQNHQSQSATKPINEKQFTLKLENISKLNQSFDTGLSSFAQTNSNQSITQNQQQQQQQQAKNSLLYSSSQSLENNTRNRSGERPSMTAMNNYQTQILSIRDTSKDRERRPKPINADFKNQLDQINESPRESILQSPTSTYHHDKIKGGMLQQQQDINQNSGNITPINVGLNKSQKLSKTTRQQQQQQQQQVDNNKQQQQNKECKTLKIDLNEDKATLEARNQIRKAAQRQIKEQQIDEQNNNKETSLSNSINQNIESKNSNINVNKTSFTSNQVQQLKKMAFNGQKTSISNADNTSNNQKNNLLLSNQNKAQSQRDTPIIQTQSVSAQSFQKKDDLVERVIESIKVLNKKEEEIKQHQLSIQSKSNQQQISHTSKKNQYPLQSDNVHSSQTLSTSLVNQVQPRRRTNTLTTGERPAMFGSSSSVSIQGNNNLIKNNLIAMQQSHQQQKENNQPVSQQIAQLKKQVQQQQQQKQQQQQQQQMQSNIKSSSSSNGFVGNSFIKNDKELILTKKQLSIEEDKNNQDAMNTSLTVNQKNDNQSSFQSKLQMKQSQNLSNSNQPQTSQELSTQKPQTSIVSKGTVVSQSTKDKVEQLRKAFISTKDSSTAVISGQNLNQQQQQQQQQQYHSTIQQQQSRSTKNLISQSQNANNFSSQASNVSAPLSSNEKQLIQKINNNNSSINNSNSQSLSNNNIKNNNYVKSEKTTKRADISLVNDSTPNQINAINLSLNLSNQGGGAIGSAGNGSNSSLNLTSTTPIKQTLANTNNNTAKKSNQITPQSKLNIATSPTNLQSNSNSSFSSSIQIKRNSQQQNNTINLNQQQNSTPVVSGSNLHQSSSNNNNNNPQPSTQAFTISATSSKTKNSRRQPTQTQTLVLNNLDSSQTQNQIQANNNNNSQTKTNLLEINKVNKSKDNNTSQTQEKQSTELVERIEGQKIEKPKNNNVNSQNYKKPHTMLDDYFHGSLQDHNPNHQGKNNNQKGSNNNSKHISISRLKNKSDMQTELEKDIQESEREFMQQRQNKLNFQPIQQPSIDWNPSPENQQMQEKKLFPLKKQQNQEYQQEQQEKQKQQQNLKIIKEENRPLKNQVKNQLQQDYSQQNNQQLQNFVDSYEQESDSQNNRIEQRLNHLLEQTRRKMINYENDDESILSEEQMTNLNNIDIPSGTENFNDGFGQISQNLNQINRMRNKALTPQINSQPQFQSINQPLPQVSIPIPQQQPLPYPYDQSPPHHHHQQQYPIIYNPQSIQYQQYQSPIIYPSQQQSNTHPSQQQQQQQPMITIINPAPIQFPSYQFPQYATNAYNQSGNNSITQFGLPPQISLLQQNQPHVIHHQPNIDLQTQPQLQIVHQQPYPLSQQQQKQNYTREQKQINNNEMIMIGGSNNNNNSNGNSNNGLIKSDLNQNASLIIGMDSQFFYPQNNSAENSLFLEDDPQIISSSHPKHQTQIQQISIPPSQIQTQPYVSQQNQLNQQQQYYVISYPQNHHSAMINSGIPYHQQIFQHPQQQTRQNADSFRSINNGSASNQNMSPLIHVNYGANNMPIVGPVGQSYQTANNYTFKDSNKQLIQQEVNSQKGSPVIGTSRLQQQFYQIEEDQQQQYKMQQDQDQAYDQSIQQKINE